MHSRTAQALALTCEWDWLRRWETTVRSHPGPTAVVVASRAVVASAASASAGAVVASSCSHGAAAEIAAAHLLALQRILLVRGVPEKLHRVRLVRTVAEQNPQPLQDWFEQDETGLQDENVALRLVEPPVLGSGRSTNPLYPLLDACGVLDSSAIGLDEDSKRCEDRVHGAHDAYDENAALRHEGAVVCDGFENNERLDHRVEGGTDVRCEALGYSIDNHEEIECPPVLREAVFDVSWRGHLQGHALRTVHGAQWKDHLAEWKGAKTRV